MTIRHSKQLTQPDGADTSKVRPSDWNDDHVDATGTPVAAMRLVISELIALDDPDAATGIAAIVVATGSYLIKAFVLRTDNTDALGSPATVSLRIGPDSDHGVQNTLITYDLENAYAGTIGDGIYLEDGGNTFGGDPGMLVDSYARGAFIETEDAVLQVRSVGITGGHCRVYALIAAP